MSIKFKLSFMSFLEVAVLGAYLTSMGNYLATIGLGTKIAYFYAIQGIVSIFIPTIMGIIADRWIPAQRLLGFNHLLSAIFMFATGFYCYTAGDSINFSTIFTLYSLSVVFFMPTIALSYSAAYNILKQNNLDVIKSFPPIRTFGTIGFIFAMLFVNFSGFKNDTFSFNFSSDTNFVSFQSNYHQFFVSAILGIVLFFFSFILPNCPVNKKVEKSSISEMLGLKAFVLFKDRKMAIFFIFCLLLGVCLQITNGYANPFISTFKDIPQYSKTWGANNANALISLSQISETLCILLIPFFLKRFGIKVVMLMAMVSWVFRFGLFAVGDPGSGVWMFILSMIFYGIAFDFVNVSGSLYVDNETNEKNRSSAQGIFFMMVNGFGSTIGMLLAQYVINSYVDFDQKDLSMQLEGWRISWTIFAGYALIVTVLFAVIFKYKHQPNTVQTLKS